MGIDRKLLTWIALFAAMVAMSSPASAVDGIVEINQAAAAAGGVTPGDAPGMPVTISRTGSYRLTGNLATSDKAVTGIHVTANDVSIDLNGFTIGCTFATAAIPVGCSGLAGGSGDGIRSDVEVLRTSVRNGVVRGMGSSGIELVDQASVEAVRSTSNGSWGIRAGADSRVLDCISSGNGSDGISVLVNSIVSDSVATENQQVGIRAGSNATVTGNLVRANGEEGIYAAGSLIHGNSVYQNGAAGIRAVSGASVIRNRVTFNADFGLVLTSSGYTENVMSGNKVLLSGADEVDGGVQMGVNLCDGSPCP